MTLEKNGWRLSLFLIIIAILLFFTSGIFGVIETSDARYSEIAREMFLSGDWLHPLLLNIHHYHKPPLTYQITALGYTFFGINPFGARFFLQISLLIQITLIYLIAKELKLKESIALYSALIYFSFPLVLASSSNLTTDSFLNTFVLASIYSWIRFRQRGEIYWFYIMNIFLGLGFLTKGPVVLIIPTLFYIFWREKLPKVELSKIDKILPIVIFISISISWFIYLALDKPIFWSYFIKHQTIERFGSNVFHRNEPFWYYWVLTPLVGAPWLLLLPWLLWRKDRQWWRPNRSTIYSLISISFITTLFFSLSSSKRIFYILPLFGLLAILVAILIDNLSKSDAKYLLKIVTIYTISLIILFIILPFIPIKNITIPFEVTICSIVAGLSVIALFRFKLSYKSRAILIVAIASTLVLLSARITLSLSPLSFKIATPIANWIDTHHLKDRKILVYDKRLPSLAFALNKPIVSLYDGNHYLDRETQFEKNKEWKRWLYNLKCSNDSIRLKHLLNNSKYILVLYKKRLPKQREWLIKNTPNIKRIGKWTIYY